MKTVCSLWANEVSSSGKRPRQQRRWIKLNANYFPLFSFFLFPQNTQFPSIVNIHTPARNYSSPYHWSVQAANQMAAFSKRSQRKDSLLYSRLSVEKCIKTAVAATARNISTQFHKYKSFSNAHKLTKFKVAQASKEQSGLA